jgi:hypothetical protein
LQSRQPVSGNPASYMVFVTTDYMDKSPAIHPAITATRSHTDSGQAYAA